MWLPTPELSDAAAAQLLDWLYEFTAAFEHAYFDQLHRYYASFDHPEHQQPSPPPLNPGEDPF